MKSASCSASRSTANHPGSDSRMVRSPFRPPVNSRGDNGIGSRNTSLTTIVGRKCLTLLSGFCPLAPRSLTPEWPETTSLCAPGLPRHDMWCSGLSTAHAVADSPPVRSPAVRSVDEAG